MYAKLAVNGIDVISSWLHEKSRIDSIITKRIDTAYLEIEDTTGAIDIQEKHEVILSNKADTERYFAGYIASLEIAIIGITKTYRCQCQDYTILLDSAIANEVYTSSTCAEIINSAFTAYLPEIDSATYVETGETVDRLVCNRWTLRELVNYLANLCGFDWYVDYNKKLHFFAKETNVAPFGLSDSPDNSATYPFLMRSYTKDATRIINLVLVRGGTRLSDDTDFELPGDGQTKELWLPYKMFAPDGETNILVWKNTGSDASPTWTAQTVGIDGIDTGKDALHNQNEKMLKFTTAPPNLKRSVKVHSKYEVPILARTRSFSSYTKYGRWFEGKVTDKDINSVALAKLRGKAVLAESAFAKEQGQAVLDCLPRVSNSNDDTLSGTPVVLYIMTSKYEEQILEAGDGTLSGDPAKLEITLSGTPYYWKAYPELDGISKSGWYYWKAYPVRGSQEACGEYCWKAYPEQLLLAGTPIVLYLRRSLTSGMYIPIKDDIRGIDDNYLIHKLSTRFLGNQVAQYTLDFGEYNPDLVDMLIDLKRKGEPYMESRDDEVLNELLMLEETLPLSDSAPTITPTGPLYYVSPAGAGHDPIKAGFWKCH